MDQPAEIPQNGPPGSLETLEKRIRRLEDALANLQDTQTVEQRIVERVSERLTPPTAPSPAPAANVGIAERRSLPLPQLPLPMSPSLPLPETIHQAWLLFDLWNELRAIVRMFFDRRYYVAWTTRLTMLILVPMILLSHFWLPLAVIPLAGPILDKVVDLILAFFLYKGLSREVARYRQALASVGQPL